MFLCDNDNCNKMSKIIYVKWKSKLSQLENPAKHIIKIYLDKSEAELDNNVDYMSDLNTQFWVLGTYDDCVDHTNITCLEIDKDEPVLYFCKYNYFKSWSSTCIYVFMSDEDRLDFISNEIIGSNKNIKFETYEKKCSKNEIINEIKEKKCCHYETIVNKKYDTQVTIENFEIVISDVL